MSEPSNDSIHAPSSQPAFSPSTGHLAQSITSVNPVPQSSNTPSSLGQKASFSFPPIRFTPTPIQNYKTKKCRHFELGRCKLAGFCNFAHGEAELRLYRGEAPPAGKSGEFSAFFFENSGQKIHLLQNNLDEFARTQSAILKKMRENLEIWEISDPKTQPKFEQNLAFFRQQFSDSAGYYLEVVSQLTQAPSIASQRSDEATLELSDEKTREKIDFFINELSNIHQCDPVVLKKLKKAKKVSILDQQEAISIIEAIFSDGSCDENYKKHHRDLIDQVRRKERGLKVLSDSLEQEKFS